MLFFRWRRVMVMARTGFMTQLARRAQRKDSILSCLWPFWHEKSHTRMNDKWLLVLTVSSLSHHLLQEEASKERHLTFQNASYSIPSQRPLPFPSVDLLPTYLARAECTSSPCSDLAAKCTDHPHSIGTGNFGEFAGSFPFGRCCASPRSDGETGLVDRRPGADPKKCHQPTRHCAANRDLSTDHHGAANGFRLPHGQSGSHFGTMQHLWDGCHFLQ
jgi:hypothetical protein